MNNSKLRNTFDIVKNFNDFQNIFYLTALSIFCLTCSAKSTKDYECTNQFNSFSDKYNEKHKLTSEQSMM